MEGIFLENWLADLGVILARICDYFESFFLQHPRLKAVTLLGSLVSIPHLYSEMKFYQPGRKVRDSDTSICGKNLRVSYTFSCFVKPIVRMLPHLQIESCFRVAVSPHNITPLLSIADINRQCLTIYIFDSFLFQPPIASLTFLLKSFLRVHEIWLEAISYIAARYCSPFCLPMPVIVCTSVISVRIVLLFQHHYSWKISFHFCILFKFLFRRT